MKAGTKPTCTICGCAPRGEVMWKQERTGTVMCDPCLQSFNPGFTIGGRYRKAEFDTGIHSAFMWKSVKIRNNTVEPDDYVYDDQTWPGNYTVIDAPTDEPISVSVIPFGRGCSATISVYAPMEA